MRSNPYIRLISTLVMMVICQTLVYADELKPSINPTESSITNVVKPHEVKLSYEDIKELASMGQHDEAIAEAIATIVLNQGIILAERQEQVIAGFSRNNQMAILATMLKQL